MKKLFIAFFLFLTIFTFLGSKTVNAECLIRTQESLCLPPKVNCPIGFNSYCCDTSIDCNNFNGEVSCTASTGTVGIDTAIGCIPIENTNIFVGWILGWAIGIGGGIAFLLIIYASFMVITSQGIPERIKGGQELLTSAISGLIMLVFSTFILRYIGLDILGLGMFGFGK